MTLEQFKKEYKRTEARISALTDEKEVMYEEGRQSMLINWALDVLPIDEVKKVLFPKD